MLKVSSVVNSITVTRGSYNEIISLIDVSGMKIYVADVIDQFKSVLPETFVSFDKKMRGDSLNLDLYAYDAD